MLSTLRPAIVMIVLFTLLTGLAYPLAVTGIAQTLFRAKADGDLVRDAAGQVVGARRIGQAFSRPEYLHPRPSAAGNGYDASNSGGSNMGPLSVKLADRVRGDAAAIARDAPGVVIPADAVTTSASGLDPDISPPYARLQAPRIAAARHVDVRTVEAVIAAETGQRLFGFIGQPYVNVLGVNSTLDLRFPMKT